MLNGVERNEGGEGKERKKSSNLLGGRTILASVWGFCRESAKIGENSGIRAQAGRGSDWTQPSQPGQPRQLRLTSATPQSLEPALGTYVGRAREETAQPAPKKQIGGETERN